MCSKNSAAWTWMVFLCPGFTSCLLHLHRTTTTTLYTHHGAFVFVRCQHLCSYNIHNDMWNSLHSIFLSAQRKHYWNAAAVLNSQLSTHKIWHPAHGLPTSVVSVCVFVCLCVVWICRLLYVRAAHTLTRFQVARSEFLHTSANECFSSRLHCLHPDVKDSGGSFACHITF